MAFSPHLYIKPAEVGPLPLYKRVLVLHQLHFVTSHAVDRLAVQEQLRNCGGVSAVGRVIYTPAELPGKV